MARSISSSSLSIKHRHRVSIAVFDWTNYLVLAKELGNRQDEASLRSAISRAYYSAFCNARNRLGQQGVTVPKTGDVHKWVWDQYRLSGTQLLQSVGIEGDRLRKVRNTADYADDFPKLASVVRTSIIRATRLLELL